MMWGLLYDPGVPTQASGIALVGRRKYSITTREKVRSYKRRRSLPQSSPFVAGVEELNDPARAKVELPSAVLNAGDDHLAMMTAVYAPFAAGVEVQNLVTQYAQGLRRLELEEAEENRIARETQSSCVSAKKSYKARARRIMLRLQYAANRSKWISSPEAALYVHTEQQHWTSHNEVPMFPSRPLYQISGNPVILNDPARAKVELILLYAGDDHLAMMTAVRLPRTVSILQPLADPPVIGHLQNIVMPMLQQMQQKIHCEAPSVKLAMDVKQMLRSSTVKLVMGMEELSYYNLYRVDQAHLARFRPAVGADSSVWRELADLATALFEYIGDQYQTRGFPHVHAPCVPLEDTRAVLRCLADVVQEIKAIEREIEAIAAIEDGSPEIEGEFQSSDLHPTQPEHVYCSHGGSMTRVDSARLYGGYPVWIMVDTTAMVVPAPRGESLLSWAAGAARYCKCRDGCVHKLEAREERFCCYCTGNICDCGCFACMRNKPDE